MTLAAVMLLAAGFGAGLLASSEGRMVPLSNGTRDETVQEETVEEVPPPSKTVAIPDDDVPGADLAGLGRYPESVRIEYLRERQDKVVWTEIEYLTDASMSEVRDYYRNTFRESDWSVNDIGFAQDSWVFFVVKDEREVFVELKPRGSGVEIDLEQTEPIPKPPEEPEPQPRSETARPQQTPPQQPPQPVVQPQRPAVVPDPVYYEDDYGEYDDDYGEYDD